MTSDMQIATALSRLCIFFRIEGRQVAHNNGLTPTQLEILEQVARRGPSRGVDLATNLGITTATLSESAGTLVTKGMAVRQPDPNDARAKRLTLTGKGTDVVASLPDAPPALLSALDDIKRSNRAALLRALTSIIRGLQEEEAIPVQRMCVTCIHFRALAHESAVAPHHCAFVDAAFGDVGLRIDCNEHENASADERYQNWLRFNTAA